VNAGELAALYSFVFLYLAAKPCCDPLESAAVVLDTVVAWRPEQTPSGWTAPSVP
jgi:hypothetical protein